MQRLSALYFCLPTIERDTNRFVLDHRLQQLMEERGPITAHIEGLEAHIRGMYDELVSEGGRVKE